MTEMVRSIDAVCALHSLCCGEAPESPLDCKEIQPAHPEGDQPDCSLEGLRLQCLGYLGY